MLLTKKTEYALLALIFIAKNKTPTNVDVLSTNLNIPKPYLAKILQSFSKRNILTSYKGINGGFILNKDASELSIYEISLISEEKIPSVFECSSSIDNCPSDSARECNIWPVLNNLQLKINGFLESISLKDIM